MVNIKDLRYQSIRQMYNNHYYNKLVDVTNDVDYRSNLLKRTAPYLFVYRIRALVGMGRLYEAEVLSYIFLGEEPNYKIANYRMVAYYLSMIYFLRGDYFKCSYFASKCDSKDGELMKDIAKSVTKKLSYNGTEESFMQVYNIDSNIILRRHIKNRHNRDFNCDFDTIYNLIVTNFSKSKTYYKNFSMFKIFRCYNVGQSHHFDSTVACDYVVVHFDVDDPRSIITFYPITNPGDLEFYDFTEEFYKEKFKKGIDDEDLITSSKGIEQFRKFYRRQSKKNN